MEAAFGPWQGLTVAEIESDGGTAEFVVADITEIGLLGPVFDQDYANLPHIQDGLKSLKTKGLQLGRYQENRIDDAAFSGGFVDTGKDNARSASTWGIGLNWYLNASSKFAVHYDRTRFNGGAATGTRQLDGKTEEFLVARYQLAF